MQVKFLGHEAPLLQFQPQKVPLDVDKMQVAPGGVEGQGTPCVQGAVQNPLAAEAEILMQVRPASQSVAPWQGAPYFFFEPPVQRLVSGVQFEAHCRVPPVYPKSLQLFPLRSEPSQASPASALLLPHCPPALPDPAPQKFFPA